MQKWQVAALILVGIAIVLTCGCMSQAAPQQVTPTATVIQTAAPIVTSVSPTAIITTPPIPTTIETTEPTPVPTTDTSAGALDAPVHLSSKLPPEGKIAFTTVRPGEVKIRVYCLSPAKAVLTSASMDQVLLQAKSSPGSSKEITINLITPQTYWITFSGFNKADIGTQKMWQLDVTNA